MSDQRLQCRNGVYYYRRCVPFDLVEKFGKKFVQLSLHTKNLKEAKKLRALRDFEWDAKFAACSSLSNGGASPIVQTSALAHPLSETALIQLVRDYVERQDQLAPFLSATILSAPLQRRFSELLVANASDRLL